MTTSAKTIVDIGVANAARVGDRPFLLWLDNGKVESRSLTFSELDRASRAFAVQLLDAACTQARASEEGRQPLALIMTRHGLEFAIAFFACLYAGVVAVPAYPPKKGESGDRLHALIADSQAVIAIADRTTIESVKAAAGIGMAVLSVDEVREDLASRWEHPPIDPESTAFIQYTSGSTGAPKGVVVTHGNLMSNQSAISLAMNHDERTIFAGWLPLFHDMGLVGNLLNPFYLGVRCVLMSPLSFIVNPIRWLEAISKYRATTSGGPNFAYELCLSRTTPEQRMGLDLSSWKVAFNGAEPVRANTIERFAEEFAPHGFDRKAIFPCYGMAEATLFVAGPDMDAPPTILDVNQERLAKGTVEIAEPHTRPTRAKAAGGPVGSLRLVSCGAPSDETIVRIIDPSNAQLLDSGQVGEIWISGPGVARGYHRQVALTDDTFFGAISGDATGHRFLRTGDLGFLRDGQLYVTGRCKDVIIVNGRNLYPQDIEASAIAAHPVLSGGVAAAFSLDRDDQEQVVLVIASSEKQMQDMPVQDLLRAVTRAVTHSHAIDLHDLVLVRSRLPVTSSGKIRRSRCRQMYQADAFTNVLASKKAGM